MNALDPFDFSFATQSPLSPRAATAVAAARDALLFGGDDLNGALDVLRVQLTDLLDLADLKPTIVLACSADESRRDALSLARASLGGRLPTIIVAPEDIASDGRPPDTISVPLRDERGFLRPRDHVDGDLAHEAGCAVASGRRVVLIANDRSQLGLKSPSLGGLGFIASASGGDVQIVIDASQARLSRKRLRWYIEREFIVVLSGATFFGGPSSSGALVVPSRLGSLRAPLQRCDLAAYLNWVAAAEEMHAYYVVPQSYREMALRQFAETVPHLIAAEPSLVSLGLVDEAGDGIDDEEHSVRSIFPFFVNYRGKLLSPKEVVALHRALDGDASCYLPANLPAMHRLLASRPCRVGAPLPAGEAFSGVGAMCISAGAHFVIGTWCDDIAAARVRLRAELDRVRAVVEKIRLLVRSLDAIVPVSAEADAAMPLSASAA